jgi:triacylglycerol lipase
VHKGFQDALDLIWPAMSRAALQYATEYCDGIHALDRLSFTGHSLGGAIAVLAATKFLSENSVANGVLRQRTEVYTFGQPKVGDRKFVCKANNMVRRIFRVRNEGDCVWKLPPGFSVWF